MLHHLLWVAPVAVLYFIGACQKVYRHRGEHHHHKNFGHKHGEGTIAIDNYAYNSGISEWNAGFKVAFSLALLIISVATSNYYVSLAVIFITTYVTVILGGLDFHNYLELLTIPIVFLIIGSIVILIDFSWTPLVGATINLHIANFFVIITSDSVQTTLMLWGRCFGAISAMYMMSLSTMSNEIFSVLKKCHCPSLLIELMNMIYRNIFIMADTQRKMRNSAESRLGYVDFKTSLYSSGSTIGNLFIVSLKRSGYLFDAMEARCYDGELNFLEKDKPITKKQLILGLAAVGYCILVWIMTR